MWFDFGHDKSLWNAVNYVKKFGGIGMKFVTFYELSEDLFNGWNQWNFVSYAENLVEYRIKLEFNIMDLWNLKLNWNFESIYYIL